MARYDGTSGNDTFLGTPDADRAYGYAGDDILSGGGRIDGLYGGDGNDVLNGDAGDDRLVGGNGIDQMYGGDGNDDIGVDEAGDFADGGAGFDSFSFSAGLATAGITVDLRDLWGGGIGYVGASTVRGVEFTSGGGTSNFDDIVYLGNAPNNASVSLAVGNDRAYGGTGRDSFSGGQGDDILSGGGGDDFLEGDDFVTGDDILNGGAGDDQAIYYSARSAVHIDLSVTTAQDTLGAGIDTLISIEDVEGSSYNDILRGNDVDNTLLGRNGDDTLYGLGGDDTLVGGNADSGVDTLIGGTGNDHYMINRPNDPVVIVEAVGEGVDTISLNAAGAYTLPDNIEILLFGGQSPGYFMTGNALDNRLEQIGSISNDTLDGGGGADTLIAGRGDDRYIVDNAGDVVIEAFDAGNDLVESSVDYRLTVHVEALTLTGTAALTGLGNTLDNAITGNEAANTLNGAAGDDSLIGGGGDDLLVGALGADTMAGGTGDDRMNVDDAGDVVVEAADAGYDTVLASIDYTLGDNVERLVLTGAARQGRGNALDNVLIGTIGADVLGGGDGDDKLYAGAGDDQITGGAGSDVLDGGSGIDTLAGGTGADRFVFREGDTGATLATADTIADFTQSDADRISLVAIDAIAGTGADDRFTFIGTAAFGGVAGQLRYETDGGFTYVHGDTDGDAVSDLVIRLDDVVALLAADFAL